MGKFYDRFYWERSNANTDEPLLRHRVEKKRQTMGKPNYNVKLATTVPAMDGTE
jgi:hypothetical protein